MGFARILVEVDVDAEFPRELDVEDEEGNFVKVAVEYPWIQVKSANCSKFGHPTHVCVYEAKKGWQPKYEGNLFARTTGRLEVNVERKDVIKKPAFDKIIRRPMGDQKKKYDGEKRAESKFYSVISPKITGYMGFSNRIMVSFLSSWSLPLWLRLIKERVLWEKWEA
ncbi:hypothetical protein SLA2020_288630 [Shorea laevis]